MANIAVLYRVVPPEPPQNGCNILGLSSSVSTAADPIFKVPPLWVRRSRALYRYIDHDDPSRSSLWGLCRGIEWAEKYPGLATTSPVTLLTDLTIVPEAVRAPVRNNLGGHWNHSFFWELMTPGGAKAPGGGLKAAIESSFGSTAKLTEKVNAAGLGRFGSGWAWLVVDKGGKLKYQNKRAEYLAAWWNTVNWDKAAANFALSD